MAGGFNLPDAQSLSLLLTTASASLAEPGGRVASGARRVFALVMDTEEGTIMGSKSLMRGIREAMVSCRPQSGIQYSGGRVIGRLVGCAAVCFGRSRLGRPR